MKKFLNKLMGRKAIWIGCFIFFCSATAYSDNKLEFSYQRQLQKSHHSNKRAMRSIDDKYYPQLIDHEHPELGTFPQRYYIDESFSTSNQSPVFFYICGEEECRQEHAKGSVRTLLAKFHAKFVALEHRYYGKSLPTKTFLTKDLKYLTTDAAVKDLASFQKFLTSSQQWSGKWFAIGGSYSGSLSAYYRLKYPDLVSGSLASSAPVMAKENFEEYDAHITKVAGPKCAANMRSAVHEVGLLCKTKIHRV